MSKPEIVEDPFSVKLDMCLTDGVIKSGAGLLIGTLSSVLFLGRRRWPIIAGLGMGIGIAYANCEHEMNSISLKPKPGADKPAGASNK